MLWKTVSSLVLQKPEDGLSGTTGALSAIVPDFPEEIISLSKDASFTSWNLEGTNVMQWCSTEVRTRTGLQRHCSWIPDNLAKSTYNILDGSVGVHSRPDDSGTMRPLWWLRSKMARFFFCNSTASTDCLRCGHSMQCTKAFWNQMSFKYTGRT